MLLPSPLFVSKMQSSGHGEGYNEEICLTVIFLNKQHNILLCKIIFTIKATFGKKLVYVHFFMHALDHCI